MPLRLIFLLLIVSGCRFQPVNMVNGGLVLIDSSLPADKAKFYHADEHTTGYPIYYMGPVADTIVLPSRPLSPYRKSADEAFDGDVPRAPADSAHLRIVVDTAFPLSGGIRYARFGCSKKAQATAVLDSIVYYKAVPVFLYNKGVGVFNIGKFGALNHIIMQARNESGNWQDVVRPPDYYCSTGASEQVLKAGEVAIAKLFLMDGDYTTTCRLKFRLWKDSVYSNVFPFVIDRRQLKKAL
ncbi:hypothetical protein HF324_23155 [Chitinophaga oryzae]|uniref:Uncharacterized protein n=1 Tax=Chitinophaga oryzae TaxID=2725414 RepID=A0ABX6LK96_9BACT|nr:hypothetical protein [Chitinophaga oryzae]QJB40575.1 hypothetical protein HF324_23155 [Chitinophaga oryzae]